MDLLSGGLGSLLWVVSVLELLWLVYLAFAAPALDGHLLSADGEDSRSCSQQYRTITRIEITCQMSPLK